MIHGILLVLLGVVGLVSILKFRKSTTYALMGQVAYDADRGYSVQLMPWFGRDVWGHRRWLLCGARSMLQLYRSSYEGFVHWQVAEDLDRTNAGPERRQLCYWLAGEIRSGRSMMTITEAGINRINNCGHDIESVWADVNAAHRAGLPSDLLISETP